MKKSISMLLICLMLVSAPLISFAGTDKTEFESHISTSAPIIVDTVTEADGTKSTIEVYESAYGRTAFIKNSSGAITNSFTVPAYNHDYVLTSEYSNEIMISQNIVPLANSSSYFTRSYTYADIIRVTGMAISTAAVIALIYATAGGATIISETIKRKITKTISSISTSLLSNSTYIKTHGVTLEYHQYREQVYRKGEKVSVMRTSVTDVRGF